MARRRSGAAAFWVWAATLAAAAFAGWLTLKIYRTSSMFHPGKILVTGYCNCEKCCSWTRQADGTAVYNYGKLKGKPKRVGVTARGTVARHGTVAADLRYYRYGVKLDIPGYGIGVVEDVGGKIKGRHIDVWFPTHEEALKWGARWLKVEPVD